MNTQHAGKESGSRHKNRLPQRVGKVAAATFSRRERDSACRLGVTKRGNVVLFMYDAQTEDGQAHKKGALVYLSHGYDADTQTRYNVFYLMHGSGQHYMEFLKGMALCRACRWCWMR